MNRKQQIEEAAPKDFSGTRTDCWIEGAEWADANLKEQPKIKILDFTCSCGRNIGFEVPLHSENEQIKQFQSALAIAEEALRFIASVDYKSDEALQAICVGHAKEALAKIEELKKS